MNIVFCGHSDFCASKGLEEKMLDCLEKRIEGEAVNFLLGGYGNFDRFSFICAKKYKEKHSTAKLIFVTAYLTEEYQKNHLQIKRKIYDEILYPPLEDKPLRFAIYYRNRYMIEQADFIVAFMEREFGGAYQAYAYAKKLGKEIVDLNERNQEF